MKYASAALLLLGSALLGLMLYQTGLHALWIRLREFGALGFGAVLVLFALLTVLESVSWHLKLPSLRWHSVWVYRLWKVRAVGDAFNVVTPLASLGGEPFKAALVKNHYGIGYREAMASLVAEQTVQNLALIPFVLTGFILMLRSGAFSPSLQLAAGSALALFSAAIVLFFVLQRCRGLSRVSRRFGRRRFRWLSFLHDVEDRLVMFYTHYRSRFALSLALEFVVWVLSVLEVLVILRFLGISASLADAWIIAALVVLVRSALFFVPAGIGTQEGAFVVTCGAIIGLPAVGLTISLIVRFRELVWVAVGLVMGWIFSSTKERTRVRAKVGST